MSDSSLRAAEELIRQAEKLAANEIDPVAALADVVRAVADTEADPYLIIGSLVEGLVHVLAKKVPQSCHADTANALLQLVVDRLRAYV